MRAFNAALTLDHRAQVNLIYQKQIAKNLNSHLPIMDRRYGMHSHMKFTPAKQYQFSRKDANN